jgi:hypothetical protein
VSGNLELDELIFVVVPEPGSMILALAGAICLACLRRHN